MIAGVCERAENAFLKFYHDRLARRGS
jgi:hypothetical protein